VFLVEAALALGDVSAARRLRQLLASYSGQQLMAGQFVAVFGPADAYLAALDSLLGDRDSADRLFAAALAQATGVGALIHRASTLAAWAAHLDTQAHAHADADAAGRAAQAVTEMRAEARRIAVSTGQERLLRMLDQAGPPPAGRPDEQGRQGGPGAAGLTPREIAVLRLLAAGSSNKEIAARLKISENTAANHVRSILLKTGAANRTQVAMLAVSRGWIADPVSARAR
jgi:DNA-binding NarL/FixJ family response regulator